MGSPLGSTIAEIFMGMLEERFFNSNPQLAEHIIYWYRYMDDVLCLWNGPAHLLQVLQSSLNNLFPTIKFTMDDPGQSSTFLDLKISITNNHHSFGIHRKPTYTDITISNSSYAPNSHKNAAFHSLIHRLTSIPLTPEEFNKELDTIRYLTHANGRHKLDVMKLVKKKLIKKALDASTTLPRCEPDKKKTKWISLPYLGEFSSQIKKLLKPHHRRPAFYSINTTKSLLCRIKDPISRNEKSGVYRIPCENCSSIYIGETGRQFQIRLHEHLDQRPKDSCFSKHLEEEGHSYRKGSATLLHVEDSLRKRIALESLESARHRSQGWEVLNYSAPTQGLIDILFPSPQ